MQILRNFETTSRKAALTAKILTKCLSWKRDADIEPPYFPSSCGWTEEDTDIINGFYRLALEQYNDICGWDQYSDSSKPWMQVWLLSLSNDTQI